MMTINMLFLKLKQSLHVVCEKSADRALNITAIKTNVNNQAMDEHILFVLPVKVLAELKSKVPVSAVIVVASQDEETEAKKLIESSSITAACVVLGEYEIVKLEIQDIRERFIANENQLLRAMCLLKEDVKILKMTESILEAPFSLFWKDFRNLYTSPEMKELLEYEEGPISPEVAHELIMDEEFHKALNYQECFYYYNKTLDRYNYCRNIFGKGIYLARMILFLPKGVKRLHPGTEELFAVVSEYIASWGITQSRLFRDLVPDSIHRTLEMILNNDALAEDTIGSVFKAAHWKAKDTYALIKYRFLAEERWNVHNEITFSFLISCLEATWPYSCGVQKGNEIIWLVNLSQSLVDVQSQEFHQQVSRFIREYVCIAGVSPIFQDLSLIPQAEKAADIALRIGRKKNPYYWFYFYENYRKEYLIETMKQEMPVSMLLPPSLLLLQQLDKEQETEYCKTLKAYLDCGYNMTSAAEKIYVHRTTFFRRMEKIIKFTGLDLEDGETCRDLMLGFLLISQETDG